MMMMLEGASFSPPSWLQALRRLGYVGNIRTLWHLLEGGNSGAKFRVAVGILILGLTKPCL